jgi:hypothetical protein
MPVFLWKAAVDLYIAIGPIFAVAFLVVFVAFMVATLNFFLNVKRRLSTSDVDIRKIIDALEDEKSELSQVLISKVMGKQVTFSTSVDGEDKYDEEAFGWWLDDQILKTDPGRGRDERQALKYYLFGILASGRNRILPQDNRIQLTSVRKYLLRRRWHTLVGVVLASVAVSLGLLGTVTGLFQAFQNADFENVGKMTEVMSGLMASLSQALYTTGIGLVLCILMVLTAFLMESTLNRIYNGLREVQDAVVASITAVSSGALQAKANEMMEGPRDALMRGSAESASGQASVGRKS